MARIMRASGFHQTAEAFEKIAEAATGMERNPRCRLQAPSSGNPPRFSGPLRRRDTGAGVVLHIDSTHIPHDPEIGELMPQAVGGTADAAALARFAALWQRRIAR